MSLLDELWNGRPNVPRGVAALLAFSECDGQVQELLNNNEGELAMAMLTDSFAARAEWQQEYGLPWEEANGVIDALTYQGVQNPNKAQGEEVLYQVPMRLLEKIGYLDGLNNYHEPTGQAIFTAGKLTQPPAEHIAGVKWRVEDILSKAYDQGFGAGKAEAFLRERVPAALADMIVSTRLAAETKASNTAWRDILQNIIEKLDPEEQAEANKYAGGLWKIFRRAKARYRTVRAVAESPVPILGLAWRIRMCAEKKQLVEVGPASQGSPVSPVSIEVARDREDDWEDVLTLASCWGLQPAAVAYLMDSTGGPCEKVLRLERDKELGRMATTILRELETADSIIKWPCGGLISERPEALTPKPNFKAVTDEELRQELFDTGLAMLDNSRRPEEIMGLPRHLIEVWPTAWLESQKTENIYVPIEKYEWQEYTNWLKAGAPGPSNWTEAYIAYRRHASAGVMGRKWLQKNSPTGWHRVEAMALVVKEGSDKELQMVEEWLAAYALEAIGGEGAETLEAYLMSVQLLGLLRERAIREARFILGKHLGNSPHRSDVMSALHKALGHIRGAQKYSPQFADRLEWAIAVEGSHLWLNAKK